MSFAVRCEPYSLAIQSAAPRPPLDLSSAALVGNPPAIRIPPTRPRNEVVFYSFPSRRTLFEMVWPPESFKIRRGYNYKNCGATSRGNHSTISGHRITIRSNTSIGNKTMATSLSAFTTLTPPISADINRHSP